MTYISKDFQVGYLPYYRLVIGASHHFDQIAILDDRGSLVSYHQYTATNPTSEVLHLLGLPFPQVDIIIPHHSVSLMPSAVYNVADSDTYADYIELKSSASLLVKEIEGFGVHALYQLDGALYHRWKKVYSEASFVPGFSALFRLALLHKEEVGVQVFIRFRDGEFADFLLIENGNLLFFNSFAVSTRDDLEYYLLLIRKELGQTDLFQRIYTLCAPSEFSWYASLNKFCKELVNDNVISGIEFPEELSGEARNGVSYLLYSTA